MRNRTIAVFPAGPAQGGGRCVGRRRIVIERPSVCRRLGQDPGRHGWLRRSGDEGCDRLSQVRSRRGDDRAGRAAAGPARELAGEAEEGGPRPGQGDTRDQLHRLRRPQEGHGPAERGRRAAPDAARLSPADAAGRRGSGQARLHGKARGRRSRGHPLAAGVGRSRRPEETVHRGRDAAAMAAAVPGADEAGPQRRSRRRCRRAGLLELGQLQVALASSASPAGPTWSGRFAAGPISRGFRAIISSSSTFTIWT